MINATLDDMKPDSGPDPPSAVVGVMSPHPWLGCKQLFVQ